MKFLRCNIKKIYTLCIILFVVYPLIVLFLYEKTDNFNIVISQSMLFVAYVFISLLFIVGIGLNAFYIRDRLLFRTPENSIVDILDDKKYSIELKNENNFFLLTEQRLHGNIAVFPVVASIYTGKGGYFSVEFSVHKTTGIYAGTNRTETLFLQFDWRRHMTCDIKSEVEKFLKQIKEKGDVVPDKDK